MSTPESNLSRREVLRRTALMLGVAAVSPAVASAVLAGAKANQKTAPGILTVEQLLLLAVLTEMILPTTDTPGANAAGVHNYIDLLVSDYFTSEHRQHFLRGLAEVDVRAKAQGFDSFVAADSGSQYQIAVALDREAYADKADGPSSDNAQTPFFRELKELTLTGYYTSEIGASVELIYDAVPGRFAGCVPYKNIGRAWATF